MINVIAWSQFLPHNCNVGSGFLLIKNIFISNIILILLKTFDFDVFKKFAILQQCPNVYKVNYSGHASLGFLVL